MKSNRKRFGKASMLLTADETHILIWVKKKRGKLWKTMYVARIHKKEKL